MSSNMFCEIRWFVVESRPLFVSGSTSTSSRIAFEFSFGSMDRRDDDAVRSSLLALRQRDNSAGPLANVAGSSDFGATTVDKALSIRKVIVEQTLELCEVDELPGLLRTGLEEGLRFPVIYEMWNSLPMNRDKLFKRSFHPEECNKICKLVNLILEPPMPAPTADTEESFRHFWDTVIEEPLRFFYEGPWLAERNRSSVGAANGCRPDKVVRFCFHRYALWRGEEKGPTTPGDPRDELLSKLDWTHKHLPFLMAYYTRACLVVFCALHMVVNPSGESQIICKELILFDTSRAADRLELVIACMNLAKLLKTMELVCLRENEESDMPLIRGRSGKIIRPCGNTVEKKYPDAALYMRVAAVYEATSSCPNVERLLHRRYLESAIVVKKEVVAKPNNYGQLIACLECLCEALQWLHREGFMHRDIRWDNVLRDRDNAEKWVLVDLDEAIRTKDCFESHDLAANSHAPEMTIGSHDTMVDIWGIGYLLKTSHIILDAKLQGLMEKCLYQDPNHRPTATKCLEFLRA
ncbi:hypothetical protein M758_10G097900 [Ceratodon purpureus]|nr:hypothetical protein M758_10G097900 [Ceratodon purpureus]